MDAGPASVMGAHNQTFTLQYDANRTLAQQIANTITEGIQNGSIIPADNNTAPSLPGGATGEFVATRSDFFVLSDAYKAVVDAAPNATIFGGGGDQQSVLAGAGNLTYFATEGSGTIAAGGGDNQLFFTPSDKGDWNIAVGNGNNTILALNDGNDSISAGNGNNLIAVNGGDTVQVGSGNDTILAHGNSGSGANLFFSGQTVGMSGADSILGAPTFQALDHSSDANNTLTGANGINPNDPSPTDPPGTVFEFVQGQVSGNQTIMDFQSGTDKIDLTGYGPNAVQNAINSEQHNPNGSLSVTLSDNTQVTFSNLDHLTAHDFTGH